MRNVFTAKWQLSCWCEDVNVSVRSNPRIAHSIPVPACISRAWLHFNNPKKCESISMEMHPTISSLWSHVMILFGVEFSVTAAKDITLSHWLKLQQWCQGSFALLDPCVCTSTVHNNRIPGEWKGGLMCVACQILYKVIPLVRFFGTGRLAL